MLQVLLEDLEKLIDSDYRGEIRPEVETAIQLKWGKILGDEYDIVVSICTGPRRVDIKIAARSGFPRRQLRSAVQEGVAAC